MTSPPPTRHSLILRIRDRKDVDSWQEFVSIYEPVIYRVAVRRGMQHADAMELVQRVFLAVARAVDRFQPDSRRAKFRTWLYRITHNEFCKEYAASRKHPSSGDTAIQSLLNQQPSQDVDLNNIQDEFSIEFRRSVFRWAAPIVKSQVKPSTWQAFWRTSIDSASVENVAEELGLSVGAVYIAKSRVMSRLQKQVRSYEDRPENRTANRVENRVENRTQDGSEEPS